MSAAQFRHQLSRLRLPLIQAPMFLVSDPTLVLACCASGIVGAFPSLNQRTTEGFEDWVQQISSALKDGIGASQLYGVNLVVHQKNERLEADLDVCVRHRVPIVFTSLGAAPTVISAVQSYGGLVIHDVTNPRHAHKAIEAGVDGLVLVSAGAGGRSGLLNPFAFLGEIRASYDGIVGLAGGLSRGEDIAAAIAAGADFAYLGTRFIATRESAATPRYKDMLVRSSASDVVFVPDQTGLRGNFLKPTLDEAGIELESRHDGPPMFNWGQPRAGLWRDVLSSGHGAGTIRSVPTLGELVGDLESGFNRATDRIKGFARNSVDRDSLAANS